MSAIERGTEEIQSKINNIKEENILNTSVHVEDKSAYKLGWINALEWVLGEHKDG